MKNYYLCYKSVLKREVGYDELMNILQVSQRMNLSHNITGMLLNVEDKIIQLIEGEKNAVTQLYKNVFLDKRHYSVKTLSEGVVDARFFPNWVMGFKALNEHDLKDLGELNGIKNLSVQKLLDEANAHIVIELLKSFYEEGGLDYGKFWKE